MPSRLAEKYTTCFLIPSKLSSFSRLKKYQTPPGFTQRGHVIRLDPTHKQANALACAVGVSRFSYNWGLAEWTKQYKAGEKPNALNLHKQFNAVKHEQFPWVMGSPRSANSRPFIDLGQAFSNFFSSCKGTRKGRKIGYPTFRKRGVDDSFYVANDGFSVRQRGKRGVVRLPVIGDVRMQEALRWQGKIVSGRVYRQADHWYIAITTELRVQVPHVHAHVIVGVDLGLKTAVVTSRGDFIDAPKPLRAALQQLKRANRKLHRRKKGSKNRDKARIVLARLHQHIANIREDFWHKTTTKLCRENQTVLIEDLSMAFMLKNRKLSRAVLDVSLGMFKPMMVYKADKYCGQVIVADKWYPSTQRCTNCGNIKTGEDKIGLEVREYVCEKCGHVAERDLNAALNLEQYPGLQGNWDRKVQTPMDDCASTLASIGRASAVAEVGTKELILESRG